MWQKRKEVIDSWATRFGGLAVLQVFWSDNSDADGMLRASLIVSSIFLVVAALAPLFAWLSDLAEKSSPFQFCIPVFLAISTVGMGAPAVMPIVSSELSHIYFLGIAFAFAALMALLAAFLGWLKKYRVRRQAKRNA